MSNHKIVDGITIQLTEEEEIQLAAERAAQEAKAPEYARKVRDDLLLSDVDPILSNALRWNEMS